MLSSETFTGDFPHPAFSQLKIVKMSAAIAVYTIQAVKIIHPVYFLAKFDSSLIFHSIYKARNQGSCVIKRWL